MSHKLLAWNQSIAYILDFIQPHQEFKASRMRGGQLQTSAALVSHKHTVAPPPKFCRCRRHSHCSQNQKAARQTMRGKAQGSDSHGILRTAALTPMAAQLHPRYAACKWSFMNEPLASQPCQPALLLSLANDTLLKQALCHDTGSLRPAGQSHPHPRSHDRCGQSDFTGCCQAGCHALLAGFRPKVQSPWPPHTICRSPITVQGLRVRRRCHLLQTLPLRHRGRSSSCPSCQLFLRCPAGTMVHPPSLEGIMGLTNKK
jgi:hypothetical protein